MSDFLTGYGEDDARRSRRLKWIAAVVGIAIVLGTTGYFLFRNYREEARLKEFFAAVERGDYKTAHAYWGCTEQTPCRDYSMEKFLEDWGPQSNGAKPSTFELTKTRSCRDGLIKVYKDKGGETMLFVNRKDLVIGFAPWALCNPHYKAPGE